MSLKLNAFCLFLALILGISVTAQAAIDDTTVPEDLPKMIDAAQMNRVWRFVTFVCVRHGQYQLYEDEYRYLNEELSDRDFTTNGIVQAILDELPLKRYLPSLSSFSQHLVQIRDDYATKDERYQAAVFKGMIITALNQEFLNGLVRIRGKNHRTLWNNYLEMDYDQKSSTELMQIAGDLIALHAKMNTLNKVFSYTDFTKELNRCLKAYYRRSLDNDKTNYKVYHCAEVATKIYPYLKNKVKTLINEAEKAQK